MITYDDYFCPPGISGRVQGGTWWGRDGDEKGARSEREGGGLDICFDCHGVMMRYILTEHVGEG